MANFDSQKKKNQTGGSENAIKLPKIPEKSSTYKDSGSVFLDPFGSSNFSEWFGEVAKGQDATTSSPTPGGELGWI